MTASVFDYARVVTKDGQKLIPTAQYNAMLQRNDAESARDEMIAARTRGRQKTDTRIAVTDADVQTARREMIATRTRRSDSNRAL